MGHDATDAWSVKLAVVVDATSFHGTDWWITDNFYDNARFYWEPPTVSRGWKPFISLILIGGKLQYDHLVSIDVLAHEVAHGIDYWTSGLIWQQNIASYPEVPALAEGLSDIWAAVIEREYAPTGNPQDVWTIGEKPLGGSSYIRNMADPQDSSAVMQMVNQYGDNKWQYYSSTADASNGYNSYELSGVLSHWFYLLAEGNGCTVRGLGMDKAARVVFNTQRSAIMGIRSYRDFALGTMDIVNYMRNPRFTEGSDLFPGLYDPSFTVDDACQVFNAWLEVRVFSEADYNVYNYPALPFISSMGGSQNLLWDGLKVFRSTVTIPARVTLTVTGTARFSPGAGLVIEPGGKVTVDGGTLTNTCDSRMWQGITVLGNSSLPQTEFERQGWLQIGNSATIEHAVCAIRNHALLPNGSTDLVTTGGNITAGSSRFIDTAQAVSLAPYTRSSGSRSTTFTDCTFEITPAYSFDHAVNRNLVRIKDTRMVYFYGCDFSYPCHAFPAGLPGGPEGQDPDHQWVSAIYVVNTQLTVKARELCPVPVLGCSSYDSCRFYGFETAIEAYYAGNGVPLKVDRTRFDRNNQGVVIQGYPSFSVTNSDFLIGNGVSLRPQRNPVGVASQVTPVFELYGNSFRGNTDNATGIHISNSLTSNSTIYGNSFSSLAVAQHFTGYNRVFGGAPGQEGLRYFCNVNAGNKDYDVLVDKVSSPYAVFVITLMALNYDAFSPPRTQGVAYHQTSDIAGMPATGNQFSDAVTWHIADYAYNQKYAGSTQPCEMPTRITPTVGAYSDKSNSCPSMNGLEIWHEHIKFEDIAIAVPGGIIDPSDNRTLEPAYHHFRNSTNTLQYLYNQHMNSDNTEALLDAVQGEWKDDV
ncbi:MAG: M4 family metallopeptidase, partial [Bacteroidales bacterium]|nr:M4 family metallopeptidase [Bacteroidales bacterium]